MNRARLVVALSAPWIANAQLLAQNGCLPQADATTVRASASSSGVMGNGTSSFPAISANGRWVAFESAANNLVLGDTNGFVRDVFVRDLLTNTTTRVSVSSSGAEAPTGGDSAAISTNGRFVGFVTGSSLVPEDTNGWADVYVHDRQSGTTKRISVSSTGAQGFEQSTAPRFSADGRFITFNSWANTLVPNDTNIWTDVFVHDQLLATTERVSVSSSGQEGDGTSAISSISHEGRYVAFSSRATNLVPGDTNDRLDVFVHDRVMHMTTLISVDSTGVQGNADSGNGSVAGPHPPEISGDGRYVAFGSGASNLVVGDTNGFGDAFVHDRWNGTVTLVSRSSLGGLGDSYVLGGVAMAAGANHFVFGSNATNLVAGVTVPPNVYLHDLVAGTTERISLAWDGAGTGVYGSNPAISADSRVIAFTSTGALVPGPVNTWNEISVRIRDLSTPITYCAPKANSSGCNPTVAFVGSPSASAGSGFHITASDVLPGRVGALAYSLNGADNSPLAGGTLCVRPPLRYTPRQTAAGSAWPPTCAGSFDVDFNFWIASAVDPALLPGAQVWTQFISRDPGFPRPDALALSDALTFVICP